jgi:nucleoprotein TPR
MFNPPAQAALTEERDQLLAEKTAWKKAPEVPPETNAVQENWEAEKAELVKNRDEAVTQAKVESTVADHSNPLISL